MFGTCFLSIDIPQYFVIKIFTFSRHRRADLAYKGHTMTSTSQPVRSMKVAWLKRDILLFANSIGVRAGDLHLLYVRERSPTEVLATKYHHRNCTRISKLCRPIQLFYVRTASQNVSFSPCFMLLTSDKRKRGRPRRS